MFFCIFKHIWRHFANGFWEKHLRRGVCFMCLCAPSAPFECPSLSSVCFSLYVHTYIHACMHAYIHTRIHIHACIHTRRQRHYQEQWGRSLFRFRASQHPRATECIVDCILLHCACDSGGDVCLRSGNSRVFCPAPVSCSSFVGNSVVSLFKSNMITYRALCYKLIGLVTAIPLDHVT